MAIGEQTTANGSTGQAQQVVEQAQEKAQQVAGQAKQQAQQAASQARDRMRQQVDQRTTQAGEQIGGQASDIRTVSEQLRQQGKDKPARLAQQAADQTERLASYLRQSDADRIMRDVESAARQQPWAVIAGGIMLGMAASRFLKASSSQRYHEPMVRHVPSPQLHEGGKGHSTVTPPTVAPPPMPATTMPLAPNAMPVPRAGGDPTGSGAF